jgi:hypothetical protein
VGGARVGPRWAGCRAMVAVELAPDGRDDLAQVAQGADERPAGGAEAVADRDLQVAVALGQEVEGEDLGVVVVVDDLGLGRGRPRQGPEAALAVADGGPGHEPEQAGEGQVAQAALGQHAPDLAGEAGTDHVVGAPLEDRSDQALQLGRVVLAVGVAERHRGRTPLHGGGQAQADGRAQPAVARHREHGRARGGGQLGGTVAGAVVDHQAFDPAAGHQLRHPGDHGRDRRLLVVGGQEHDHRPGTGRGAVAGRVGRCWQAEGHVGCSAPGTWPSRGWRLGFRRT